MPVGFSEMVSDKFTPSQRGALPMGTIGDGLCAVLQHWDAAKTVGFIEEQLNFLPIYQAIFEHVI